MDCEHETASLSDRQKKSPMKISCCFQNHRSDSLLYSPRISPTNWLKSKLRCHDRSTSSDQECIRPSSGSGKHHRHRSTGGRIMAKLNRHRRHSSAELSYDPLSYALNFEDDDPFPQEAEDRNFTSRLPVSPPRSRLSESPSRAKKLEDLAAKMEALEMRKNAGDYQTTPVRDKTPSELRDNMFEVRVPRLKTDLPRAPNGVLTPSPESRAKEMGSRPDGDIMVWTC